MRDRGIVLDRTSTEPLHRQLAGSIRDAILAGRLKSGERVLSSRELQTHLGLSRNTIVSALGQLHAEGYLVSHRGVGTFVAEALSGRGHAKDLHVAEKAIVPSAAAAALVSVHELAQNLSVAAPFRPGLPALDFFPATHFRRALNAYSWTPQSLDYPSCFGNERLREAISQRLQQTRGVACAADQILIVGGAQAAFSLVARVLLNRNDAAVVEEPGYPSVRAVLLAHGARLIAAPVDEAGIKVGSLPRGRVALLHTTPSHQYPTGAVLSLERRFALLEWAEKREAWIVEDDYDSEFNYTGKPQPALHGLDGGRRVLYVGTFSKVLSPALRIGYIVIPKSLRSAFSAAQQVTGGYPSAILQSALATFMENGHLARHITRMRGLYDERRRFTAAEFGRRFGSSVRVQDSTAGLHFVVHLPQSVKDSEFSLRASNAEFVVPALSSYFHKAPTLNGIVVGFAGSSPAVAREAIATMAGIL